MSLTKEPVILNVYDLEWAEWWPKKLVWMFGLGIFHSGIQVFGSEFNFTGHPHHFSGIYRSEPRCTKMIGRVCKFKTSVTIGYTKLSKHEVFEALDKMGDDWSGATYHLLNKNCNHFSNEFCENLCKKSIPCWVNRLAKFISSIPFLEEIVPTDWVQQPAFVKQIKTEDTRADESENENDSWNLEECEECGCKSVDGIVTQSESPLSASKTKIKIKCSSQINFIKGERRTGGRKNNLHHKHKPGAGGRTIGFCIDDSDSETESDDDIPRRNVSSAAPIPTDCCTSSQRQRKPLQKSRPVEKRTSHQSRSKSRRQNTRNRRNTKNSMSVSVSRSRKQSYRKKSRSKSARRRTRNRTNTEKVRNSSISRSRGRGGRSTRKKAERNKMSTRRCSKRRNQSPSRNRSRNQRQKKVCKSKSVKRRRRR